MLQGNKIVGTALLSALGLMCSTLTVYSISIWWRGGRGRLEVLVPGLAGLVASLLVIGYIAVSLRQERGSWAVIRAGALLTLGCILGGSALFFGVLDNCRLRCGSRIRATSSSPGEHNKAVL